MDPGDGRLAQFRERAQHGRQLAGVSAILLDGVAGGALHPVQVSPGGKALAPPGQHDHPHRLIAFQGLESSGEFGDQGFIKSVVPVGTVHPDRRYAVLPFDFQSLKHGS